ncbi:hypothetical protein C8J57DRAFT_1259553 [Mycena rebaudengoi]|nr:hypothetical protein C8J57DRAFT_1259553 [Mycena rebaudengoi]
MSGISVPPPQSRHYETAEAKEQKEGLKESERERERRKKENINWGKRLTHPAQAHHEDAGPLGARQEEEGVRRHVERGGEVRLCVRPVARDMATGWGAEAAVLGEQERRSQVWLRGDKRKSNGCRLLMAGISLGRSWELCIVPDKPQYNLSYECLTSRDTPKALRKYIQEDKVLADEIRARVGPATLPDAPEDLGLATSAGITDDGEVAEEDLEEEDEVHDDSDVPLAAVVDRVLRVRVRNPAGQLVAKRTIDSESDEGLISGDAEEDIWAYNSNGELWTKVGATEREESSSEDGNASDNSYNAQDDD